MRVGKKIKNGSDRVREPFATFSKEWRHMFVLGRLKVSSAMIAPMILATVS